MKIKLVLFTILSCLSLVSCSSGGSNNNQTPSSNVPTSKQVYSVAITPNSLELDLSKNNTAVISVSVNADQGVDLSYTLKVLNKSIVSVSEDGLVTALKEGETVIEAVSKADPNKIGECSVKVTKSGEPTPPPTPGPDPEPERGDGSYENPFSAEEAYDLGKTLEKDETTTLKYFIKGKVISDGYSTSGVATYGNMNFKITSNNNNAKPFYCFQVYYLNGNKFTTSNVVNVNDEVVMFSAIVNYGGNTPETTNKGSAYVFKHNNKESSTIPEQGLPTEDPNAKERSISTLISENSSYKSEGAKTGTLYRIKGVVQWPNNYTYGNFDLIDESGYIAIHGATATKQGLLKDGNNGYVINNDRSFGSINVKAGDEISIEGWYAYHLYSSSYGVPQFTGYITKLERKGASNITPKSSTASEDNTLSYYASVNNLTGEELLKGLHNLMDTTHTTYTSYSSLGNHFKKSDKHPSGGVKCFYSGASTNSYNKEHVWPQSQSADLYGENGGGSDLHHIRPTISSYNSKRGNSAFGPIYGCGSNKGGSFAYSEGGTVNYVNYVFEPVDSMKGDVARIIMYMYMHYNDGTLSELSSLTDWNQRYGYYGQMHINWVMGPNSSTECFNLLRKWNAEDPVSQEEKTRNEYTYGVQGNRNPFIDHPSYADKIWG